MHDLGFWLLECYILQAKYRFPPFYWVTIFIKFLIKYTFLIGQIIIIIIFKWSTENQPGPSNYVTLCTSSLHHSLSISISWENPLLTHLLWIHAALVSGPTELGKKTYKRNKEKKHSSQRACLSPVSRCTCLAIACGSMRGLHLVRFWSFSHRVSHLRGSLYVQYIID